MSRPSWAPPGIDLTRPSAARVYDYYLGGSHNFSVDRRMAQEAIQMWPELPSIMQANRAFLRRAVTYVASLGVDQFIDIGSGIPTVGNVHEVVHHVNADARVIYVDNDPVAVAHSRAILADTRGAMVVEADLRDAPGLFDAPALQETIDLERPVALLLVAVLHFVSENDDPYAAVHRCLDQLAPGSYLVLSHASTEGQPALASSHRDLYDRTPTPMTMRSRDQIARFFTGLELVEPGLVSISQWRPEVDDLAVERMVGYAGVGHKM
jgi:SAM-dependent methyltransferase